MKKLLFGMLCVGWGLTAGATITTEMCQAAGGTIVYANGNTNAGTTRNGYCNNSICDEGEEGYPCTCNTKVFCQSGKTMNWWSAWAWCKSLDKTGGTTQLVSWESACGNISAGISSAGCTNLKSSGSNYSWTSYGWGSSLAVGVYLSSGAVDTSFRNYNYYISYALCE